MNKKNETIKQLYAIINRTTSGGSMSDYQVIKNAILELEVASSKMEELGKAVTYCEEHNSHVINDRNMEDFVSIDSEDIERILEAYKHKNAPTKDTPVDTLVRVWDKPGYTKETAYFCRFDVDGDDYQFYVFTGGRTSKTVRDNHDIEPFTYAEIVEEG